MLQDKPRNKPKREADKKKPKTGHVKQNTANAKHAIICDGKANIKRRKTKNRRISKKKK